jgi:hypothetical protein
MSIVSLVLAPTLAKMDINKNSGKKNISSQTVEISMISTDSSAKIIDSAKTITISTSSKTLLQALQEDGLAPKDSVNIQVVNDKITVNGKPLTDAQNAKYAIYLVKKIEIKKQ